MKIAILGSWRLGDKEQWRLSGSETEFTAACEQIGNELALRKQRVIVGGEDPETADYHVVRGIMQKADDTVRLIEVVRIADDDQSFREQNTARKGLFMITNVGAVPDRREKPEHKTPARKLTEHWDEARLIASGMPTQF
jgi:hypothetical protein